MSNEEQEYDEVSEPEYIFLWPDKGLSEDIAEMWLSQSFVSAHVLTGQVCDLTEADVDTWSGLLQHNLTVRVRLIMLLYPACRTRRETLAAFRQFQEEFVGSIEIRVVALDQYRGTPTSIICCYDDKGRSTALAVGPRVSLSDLEPGGGQINLTFKPEPLLADRYQKWFDRQWEKAARLSERIIDIPYLVPARGSPDAAEAWDQYLSLLRRVRDTAEAGQTQEDEGDADNPAGAEKSKILSEELGLQQMTELERQVGKLFEKGHLVTVDKTTRLKPLDAPMKPEWFGVEGFRQEGAVNRKVQYRISVLHDKTLATLQAKMDVSSVLRTFTFSLADGARWIPKEAVPLLEKELDRVNSEGMALLRSTVGTDGVDVFVGRERSRLIEDANRMYRDFRPSGTLSEAVIDEITRDLTARLRDALNGTLLPAVSYATVQPALSASSEWISQFGQTYCLLLSVAKYPRNAKKSGIYFCKGLQVDKAKLLSAMNVCGDYILDHLGEQQIDTVVQDELGFITYVEDSPADTPHKCQALWDLMKGVPREEIARELDQTSQ